MSRNQPTRRHTEANPGSSSHKKVDSRNNSGSRVNSRLAEARSARVSFRETSNNGSMFSSFTNLVRKNPSTSTVIAAVGAGSTLALLSTLLPSKPSSTRMPTLKEVLLTTPPTPESPQENEDFKQHEEPTVSINNTPITQKELLPPVDVTYTPTPHAPASSGLPPPPPPPPPPPGRPPPPPPPPGGPGQNKVGRTDPTSQNEIRKYYEMLRNLAKGKEINRVSDAKDPKPQVKKQPAKKKGHRAIFEYFAKPVLLHQSETIIRILKARISLATYTTIPSQLASELQAKSRTEQLQALKDASQQRVQIAGSTDTFSCTAGIVTFDSLFDQYVDYCKTYVGCRAENDESASVHVIRRMYSVAKDKKLKTNDLLPWVDLHDHNMNGTLLELPILWHQTTQILCSGNQSLQEGLVSYILKSNWYPTHEKILARIKESCKKRCLERKDNLLEIMRESDFDNEDVRASINNRSIMQQEQFEEKMSSIMTGKMSDDTVLKLNSNFEKIRAIILTEFGNYSNESPKALPHKISLPKITCEIDLLLTIFENVSISEKLTQYNRSYIGLRLERMCYFYYPQLFMQAGLFKVTGPIEDTTFCGFSQIEDAFEGYGFKMLGSTMLAKHDNIDMIELKIELIEKFLTKNLETPYVDIPPNLVQSFLILLKDASKSSVSCDEKKEYDCYVVNLSHEDLDALSPQKVKDTVDPTKVLQESSERITGRAPLTGRHNKETKRISEHMDHTETKQARQTSGFEFRKKSPTEAEEPERRSKHVQQTKVQEIRQPEWASVKLRPVAQSLSSIPSTDAKENQTWQKVDDSTQSNVKHFGGNQSTVKEFLTSLNTRPSLLITPPNKSEK